MIRHTPNVLLFCPMRRPAVQEAILGLGFAAIFEDRIDRLRARLESEPFDLLVLGEDDQTLEGAPWGIPIPVLRICETRPPEPSDDTWGPWSERPFATVILTNLFRAFRTREKELLDRIPTPAFLWRQEADDFRLIGCNRPAREQPESRIEEYIGILASEMYGDSPEIVGAFARCIRGGETVVQELEYRFPSTNVARPLRAHYARVPPRDVLVCTEDLTRLREVREQLDAAEALYRGVYENAGDGIALLDDAGRYVAVNPAGCRIMGRSEAELLERSPTDFVVQEEVASVRTDLATVDESEPRIARREILWPDGSRRQLDITVSMMPDGGVLGVFRDVSEAESARRQLIHTRQQLETAQRIAGVGSWVWDIESGELAWSDESFRIFGLEPGSVEPTYDLFLDGVHPDDRQRVQDAVGSALDTGRPYSVEHRLVRPDGSVRVVEERGETVANATGRQEMHGTVLDITERKQVEAHLAKLSSALEQADDHVVITDRHGVIEYANPAFCALTGYEMSEVIGREPGDLVRSGHHDESFFEDMWTTLLNGEVFRAVFVNQRKDGSLFYDDKMITPIRDEDGDITHFVSTGRDITEQRQATERQRQLQESLRRSQTMATMGALVSGVAHEVRNPLFGLSAALDAFEVEYGQQEGIGNYLQVLRSQVSRMSNLMTSLLEYGRPHSQTLSVQPLEPLVHDAVEHCAGLLADHTLQVDLRVPDELRIRADPGRLLQVLINLLENAAQMTPKGSAVGLSVGARECPGGPSQITLRVWDTGPGFDDDALERIFEPFFSRRRNGTGLGLSIVERIVEEHSGEVAAGNRLEGGAWVEISLPTVATDDSGED